MAIPLHSRLLVVKNLHTQLGFVPLLLFIFLTLSIDSQAQFTKLLDFGTSENGLYPRSTPISDGTFLYGMTAEGGAQKLGVIYKVKLDGTGYTKLLDFDGTNGANPYGSLVSDGTFLYGMTQRGGANGQGAMFKIKMDGTGFAKLLDFSYGTNGGFPLGSLIYDGTFLYGMTTQGGSKFYGTIFKILPDGSGYSKLLEFDYTTTGGYPYGSLVSDGTFLYGMTTLDGASDNGTIFKIKLDGSGYTKLLTLNATANGSLPWGSLISDGTFLYGMTRNGGSNNQGTIFKIMPDGTGFVKLLNFSNTITGGYPTGSLVSDGTFLYGTTVTGGTLGYGTIFKIKPDGTGFVKLKDEDNNSGGPYPEGTLLLNATTLFGVKSSGGPGYFGTTYKINTDGSGYSTLVNFEVSGNNPTGSLISDGTFLYGMTAYGGLANYGTVFKIKPDGTGFLRLLNFDGSLKGSRPSGSLISDGTFLYGMTGQGGANDAGVIFKVKPDGTGFLKLLDFDYTTLGGSPSGALVYDGAFLYGTTFSGGTNSYGTIFKIKPDGTGFATVLNFDYTKGSYPNGSLIYDGTFLYGTTYQGGSNGGFGVVYKIKPDGTGFLNLHDFNNTDGRNPRGSLIASGSVLYGMTSIGSIDDSGNIYKINTDGSGFTELMPFISDNTGGSPTGALISDGTFLYGLANYGGTLGLGTMFKIKTDGTSFTKLYEFNDGQYPAGSLFSDGSFLYGAAGGGANGLGTLFKRSLAPFTIITNFTPAEGVEGTLVTINGVDFDPTPANNLVKFDNTNAVVVSATASTLTAFVPVGATSGAISVTANGTDISIADFTVTPEAYMTNDLVKNCNVTFWPPTYEYIMDNSYDDVIETFVPVNPSDKVKISFSSFDVEDLLSVYDGPTTSSPLIATLNGNSLPADIVATGPGGELTFSFSWQDASSYWGATITCVTGGNAIPPSITSTPLTTAVAGKITLDLVPLINAPGTLDINSIEIVVQPASGAIADINNGILSIDYAGKVFKGNESITIKACDLNSLCAEQTFFIEVLGEIIIYNAISPNTDGLNEIFRIENIDLLADTKENTVTIYNRWGSKVFEVENYNNNDRVFKGLNQNGNELPSGTYFYKIVFPATGGKRNGYLEIKR